MQTKNVRLTASMSRKNSQKRFKRLTKGCSAAVAFVFLFSPLAGQGEIEEKTTLSLKDESSGAFYINTNGWGGNYRYAKRKNYFNRTFWESDFVIVKDPKEVKVSSQINTRSFVMGKLNSCGFLRGGYGRQKEIFSRFDKGSIAIRYFYSGGLSLALCKPYYYTVWYKIGENTYIEKEELYTEATGAIVGKAPFSTGLEKTTLIPGIYGRGGFSFEINKNEDVVNAIELGAGMDLFPQPIRLMANHMNQQIFATFYISYRFGKAIENNPDKKKPKHDFFEEEYF